MRSSSRTESKRALGAVLAVAGLLGGGCVTEEVISSDVQAEWRKVGSVAAPDEKLDVVTDRVLPYRLINTADDVTTVKEFELHLHDGKAEIPLRTFFGPKLPAEATSDYEITPRGYVSSPNGSAIPGVMMMLDSLPEDSAEIGATWTRHRPSDEEAAASRSAVRQSIRNFEVIETWETPQGNVIRVQVDGYVRWFDNEYIRQGEVSRLGFSGKVRPEHTGYVDVNLDTGVVVDASFHVDVASKQILSSDLEDPKFRVVRLCPGEGADFVPSADTCALGKGGA